MTTSLNKLCFVLKGSGDWGEGPVLSSCYSLFMGKWQEAPCMQHPREKAAASISDSGYSLNLFSESFII